MKIALLQLNPTVGDIDRNAELIIRQAIGAYQAGARLVLTPELVLSGSHPKDLLLRSSFIASCDVAVKKIMAALAPFSDLYLLLGHPTSVDSGDEQGHCYNALSLLKGGALLDCYAKRSLDVEETVSEGRYFLKGTRNVTFEVEQGIRFGVSMGVDLHSSFSIEHFEESSSDTDDIDLLLHFNIQPYHSGVQEEQEQSTAHIACVIQKPVIVTQMVGGQDEFIYAGGSFAVDEKGVVVARASSFAEDVIYLELQFSQQQGASRIPFSLSAKVASLYDADETLWRALVMGLKDYVSKNNFQKVLIGLSGGMDSALVLALAVDALGAERVHTMMMPSAYTSDISLTDAKEMATRLSVCHDEVPITAALESIQQTLVPALPSKTFAQDTTEENLQARIRGVILMALSNRSGALVLACGNKSEMAMGYCTLYGDMVGGFAPIKDVPKTGVYRLAKWRNQHNPLMGAVSPIPERIIIRPPSAELREDQTDQDSLPSYEVIDAVLQLYMEEQKSVEAIIQQGYSAKDVEKVVHLIRISEYKRSQAPIGPKLTRCAFGTDWNYPLTSKFSE